MRFLKTLFSVLAKCFVLPTTIVFFKPRYIYEDKRVQNRKVKGGILLVSNHKGPLDFMLMFHAFWRRRVRCVVGEVMFTVNALMGFLLRALDSIKADRIQKCPAFIGESVSTLKRGGFVELYPEAHFPKDEHMQPFTLSAALIALQANVPVLPVYTDGRYHILKRATLVIGKPIYLSDYCPSSNPTKEELIHCTEVLRNKVLALSQLAARHRNAKVTAD